MNFLSHSPVKHYITALHVLILLILTSVACSPSCASSKSTRADESPTQAAAAEEAPQPRTAEERQDAVDASTASMWLSVAAAAESSTQAYGQWREEMLRQAMDAAGPLPQLFQEALASIEFDPHPESITRNTHYWVSNEYNHQLFRPTIKEHGGIYLGVGTDQNYLLAAWARSPLMIPMDFDEQIRNTHHIYGVIFKRVETPEDFIEHWNEPNSETVLEWIKEDFGDGQRYSELSRTFGIARTTIFWRLRTTARTYRARRIPTFLTDQEEYDFIRNLWKNNRVFPTRGDLTADTTLVNIASILKELELHLGLVYTSNAEQYFPFTPEYRRNIIVQPFSETALILRTRPISNLGFPEGGDYHYNIQNAQNFARWMEVSPITNSFQLLTRHRQNSETEGLSFITAEPPESENRPRIADRSPQETPE